MQYCYLSLFLRNELALLVAVIKPEDLHASALYILKIYWFSPTVISSMLRALVTVFEGLDPTCKSDTIPPQTNSLLICYYLFPSFISFTFTGCSHVCQMFSAVNPSHDKPIQFTIFQKRFRPYGEPSVPLSYNY
jgi:hypothetical protein